MRFHKLLFWALVTTLMSGLAMAQGKQGKNAFAGIDWNKPFPRTK